MYQQNLALIKKRFPFLDLNQDGNFSQPDIVIDVSRSKTGLPVAQVTRNQRRIFLNSSYDPILDASRWIERNLDPNTGHVILCGAGFFYHVKALLESPSIKKLVIYEPNPAILYAAMQEIDLAPLFEHDNFLLLTGLDYDEMIKGALGFLNNGLLFTATDIQIKILTSYSELFHDEIHIFQEKLREFFRLMQMNLSTTDAYAKQWLSNAFATFPNAVNSPVIRHYFGQFKNIPAIVVSAGPSLEKNIHLVNSIKENAVVICAGSSIRAMKRNGVSPHFLVAVDGHEINNKVYGDLDLSDVYLVYNFRFWHEIVSKYSGRKILMKVDAESLPDLFITQNGGYEIGSLKSGFSVSHTSLNLAFQLGCNPIILIGQDLSYAPTKRYADGQISSSQKYLKEGEIPANCFYTKDIHGQDVLTDYELDSFRMLLERMIETSYRGKVNIINATEGGVHIKGTTEKKLSDVISEYCLDNRQIGRKIESLYERGLKEIRNHKIDPIAYCSKLKIITNRAIIKMMELLDELQALRKRNFSSEFIPEELDPLLDKITNSYDQALNYKEYHFLLKDIQTTALSVNKARLNEFDQIRTAEDYDQKLQIYLNIIADTQKTLEFVMDCIEKVLVTADKSVTVKDTAVKIGNALSMEKQIKAGTDLPAVQRLLENSLQDLKSSERALDLYLYGMLLHTKGESQRSIDVLEEAVKIDPKQAKAYFLLFKIYYRSRNYSKALQSLEHCRELKFKIRYCQKMQLKINYQIQNWVAAANLATEALNTVSYKKALLLVKMECLCRLALHSEAQKMHRDFVTHYRISEKIVNRLQELFNHGIESEYQKFYCQNQNFFDEAWGIHLPDYGNIRYQICRYLSGEYAYDKDLGQIFSGINHTGEINIKLSLDDCLAIYNTDNTKIFEHLVQALEGIEDIDDREKISNVPVFILDDNMEDWCLLAQLFNFETLKGWRNLHYYIEFPKGISDIFMNEETPWPNAFYGTDVEKFTESLFKIKQLKDQLMQQRLLKLREHYQSVAFTPAFSPHKILVITSQKDKTLYYYGQALQHYLTNAGMKCLLHTESPTFHTITVYSDVKLIAEFEPDLVIDFLGVQEEFEAVNSLAIPFVSWFLQEKHLRDGLNSHCLNQIILVNGNLNVRDSLVSKGYQPQKIHTVGLPYFLDPGTSVEETVQDIAIFADSEDLEAVIHDLGTVIQGMIFMKTHSASLTNILTALKAIYFQVFSRLTQDELKPLEMESYLNWLAEHLQRYQFKLNQNELKMVAGFVKTEFESLIFKRLQIKWIVDEFKNYSVGIYGSGWTQDPTYQTLYKGEQSVLVNAQKYRDLVVRNKINLCLSTHLKNKSVMQPDFIEGIAAGGFFLTSKRLESAPEGEVPSFDGLLETFSSRTDLVKKLNYFLAHPHERLKRAGELQNYVLTNFNIGKIVEKYWRMP